MRASSIRGPHGCSRGSRHSMQRSRRSAARGPASRAASAVPWRCRSSCSVRCSRRPMASRPSSHRRGRSPSRKSGSRRSWTCSVRPSRPRSRPSATTRETITAENVEERAEGAAAQESDISYALVNEPIRMIAGSIPVTEEQLDDVPTVRALLEGRLTYLGIRRLDKQLARGDGTGVNIKGLSGRDAAMASASCGRARPVRRSRRRTRRPTSARP